MISIPRIVIVLLLAASTTSPAQTSYNWMYESDFVTGPSPQGVAIDPDGKLWVSWFAQTDTLPGGGATASGIDIYDLETGNPAPFSPITTFMLHGNPDTLRYNNRGLTTDHNGNILTCSGRLYRFDYRTGEAMNRYDYLGEPINSLTRPAVDDNGFIYLTKVVPADGPIVILDEDFQVYAFAVNSTSTISRSLLAGSNGQELFHGAIYPGVGAIRYFSQQGPDGVYSTVDTLNPDPRRELWGQCLEWGPRELLWVGSYWDTAPGAFRGWYGINSYQNTFEDSLGINLSAVPGGTIPPGGSFYAPRGVAFRYVPRTGIWEAYTADFDGNVIKKWTNNWLGIVARDDDGGLVQAFDLGQNYPTPFNPATAIPFRLGTAALVQLQIFNARGQLVKTLVNETLNAGSYEYQYDGGELASGAYIYRLSLDGKYADARQMHLAR